MSSLPLSHLAYALFQKAEESHFNVRLSMTAVHQLLMRQTTLTEGFNDMSSMLFASTILLVEHPDLVMQASSSPNLFPGAATYQSNLSARCLGAAKGDMLLVILQ